MRSTNDAYAEAFLGSDAAMPADALTVHPYLGFGAMEALVSEFERLWEEWGSRPQ